ncbi:DUF6114 domain-containing protein [Streptomyces sp. NPDC088725]|uniref:DUF6114 domain-containing protein n=1 Tax=Streptomyces sp. NPDC088725 TaxID=3365873 RepID=UPI00381B2DE2
MSAESSVRQGRFTYWRLRFRAWRGARPFWAGLFTVIGGVPIAYLPYANLQLGNLTLAMATTAGAGSLIIGVLLVTLGLTMWYHSIVRVFAGVATILLALVSIPVSNFGGLVIGFLLALVGGSLSIAWAPGKPAEPAGRATENDGRHRATEPDGADDPYLPAAYGSDSYGSDPYGTGGSRTDSFGTEGHGPGGGGSGGRHGKSPNVTDTTAHANGGRNSAG